MAKRQDRYQQRSEDRESGTEAEKRAVSSLPPEVADQLPFWIEATPASRSIEERLRYQEALLMAHELPSQGQGSCLRFRGEEFRYFMEFFPPAQKHILEIRSLVYLGTVQAEPALHALIVDFEGAFREEGRSANIYLHDTVHMVADMDLRYRRDPLPHASFGLVEFMGQRSLQLREFLATVDDRCFFQRDYSQAWEVLEALSGRKWS
jgi:hypothetical protein